MPKLKVMQSELYDPFEVHATPGLDEFHVICGGEDITEHLKDTVVQILMNEFDQWSAEYVERVAENRAMTKEIA